MRMPKKVREEKKKKKESLKLLKMKNSALLVDICFTGILTTSCFHCLCVILAPRYWQFHVFIVFKMTMSLNLFYFVSSFLNFLPWVPKMDMMNDLCIPHFSIIFYFVTKILAISCYHCQLIQISVPQSN